MSGSARQALGERRIASGAYREIFEHGLDGVLFTAPDGRILAANPAACQLFRLSEEEICRRGRKGLTDPTDERWSIALAEREHTGRARSRLLFLRGDGSRFVADTSSNVFTDERGERRTCVILRDVTDVDRAEQHLQAISDLTYALLAGSSISDVLTMAVKHARQLVGGTSAWIFQLGREPDSVEVIASDGDSASSLVGRQFQVGDTPVGVAIREGRPVFVANLATEPTASETARELGLGSTLVFPLRSGDTSFGTIAVAAGRDQPPFDSDARDVVDLFAKAASVVLALGEARAEAARHALELVHDAARFTAMVEHGSDLITITGADRCLKYVSPAFGRILGEDPSLVLGRPIWEFVHPDDRERLGGIFTQLKSRPGGMAEFECRLMSADGTLRHVIVTQTNLLDDPAVEGFVGNARDITELHDALEAQHRLESLRAIADVVSLHRSLTTAVSIGRGLVGIAEVVQAVVGGVVVVDDVEGTRSARAGESNVDVGPVPDWRHLTDPPHAEVFREGDWLIAVARPAGEVLGAIGLFDPAGESGPSAAFALEQATTVLATEVFRLRSVAETELKVWGDLASELLDDPDPTSGRSHAIALGYNIDRPHRALLVERGPAGVGPETSAVRRAARLLGLDSSLMTSRASGVVLLVADDVDWDEFDRALAEQGLGAHRLGVGDRHEPTTLRQSLAEAELALRLSAGDVVRFSELGVWRFLAADADPTRLRSFVDQWIGVLADYDASHNSDLVQTLAEYLRSQGSIASTATTLYIHPSTLKYRLRRIRQLTGRDLRDPEQRFNLELAYRANKALDVQARRTDDSGSSAPRSDVSGEARKPTRSTQPCSSTGIVT